MANWNEWDDFKKAPQLIMSLQGGAQRVFWLLNLKISLIQLKGRPLLGLSSEIGLERAMKPLCNVDMHYEGGLSKLFQALV